MRYHSQVLDNFFKDPHRVRELIKNAEMKNELGPDGVTYPGIVKLPEEVVLELKSNLLMYFGDNIEFHMAFARYSFQLMDPPHWAHSDQDLADFVGLIYLNPTDTAEESGGTYLLKHKKFGFEIAQTVEQKKILLQEANDRHNWNETFYMPARFNRISILNSQYIHAAANKYGDDKDNARLVVSVFFSLKE